MLGISAEPRTNRKINYQPKTKYFLRNKILFTTEIFLDISWYPLCWWDPCPSLFRLMVFLFKITTRQRQLDLLCHSDKQSWGWLNLTFCFPSFLLQTWCRYIFKPQQDYVEEHEISFRSKTLVPRLARPLWHYRVVPQVLVLMPGCLTSSHLPRPWSLLYLLYLHTEYLT